MPSRSSDRRTKRRRRSKSTSSSSSSNSDSDDEKKRKKRPTTSTTARSRADAKKPAENTRRKRPSSGSRDHRKSRDQEKKPSRKRSRSRPTEKGVPADPAGTTLVEEEDKLNRTFNPEDFVIYRRPDEGVQPLNKRAEFTGRLELEKSVEIGLPEEKPREKDSGKPSDHHSSSSRKRRNEESSSDKRRDSRRKEGERRETGKDRRSEGDLRLSLTNKRDQREIFTVKQDKQFRYDEQKYGNTGRLLSDRWDPSRPGPAVEPRPEPVSSSRPVLVEYPRSEKLARAYNSYPETEDRDVLRGTGRSDYGYVSGQQRSFGSTDYRGAGFGSSGPRNIRDAVGDPSSRQPMSYGNYGAGGYGGGGAPRADYADMDSRRGWYGGSANRSQYGSRRFQNNTRGRGGRGGGFRSGRETVVYRPGAEEEKNVINLFDPQKVPKGGGYFDHDQRDAPRPMRGRGERWSRGGPYSSFSRRSGVDDVWKHDMFKNEDSEDSPAKGTKREEKVKR